jgi:hypothetical protein
MSDSTQSSDEENGNDTQRDLTRRAVLHGAAGTTVLALAAGGVAANGKGGQAFVDADAVAEAETFEFESTEPQFDEVKEFSCNGNAELPFPYWNIDVDGSEYKLYTRDNSIDTDVTYRWTNDKGCNDEYRQVGFAVD